MELRAEDLRRQFESLTDEALLEVERDQLVDLARECYDAEVASRGLTRPAAAPAASVDSDKPGDLVAAAEMLQPDEASLAKTLLESAGIPSWIEGQGKLAQSIGMSDGVLSLMVAPDVLEDARAILESPISDEELAAQAEAEPPPPDYDD